MARLFRAAAVAIVKNEAPYIAEWLDYHALLGIEHAFLFDNNSDDDLAGALRPYLVQGRATLLTWPGWPEQMSAYNYAIRMFGHACDWMTLLDGDEFIHLARPGTLPDYWDSLGDVDQVLMSWMIFGAGGHDAAPDGLVIDNYRRRLESPSAPVKCAVRPEAVISAEVHHCVTRRGRSVDGDGRAVPESWRLDVPAADTIRVNHYITKSRAEWVRKVSRGQADGTVWRKEEEFLSYQGDRLDEATAARAPEVRRALAATAAAAAGHVSHNRSPLSELTPSRRWTRQAMRRLQAAEQALADGGAWQLPMAVDDVRLVGKAGFDLVGDAADAAFAAFAADLGAGGGFGRPYLSFVANCDVPSRLVTIARGRDANGHPHEHRTESEVAAGTTIGFKVLSPRTMTVDTVDCDWSGEASGGRLRWQRLAFV